MGTQQEFPIHPLARMFPPLTLERYAALVASIIALGLLDPITVWRGQIIDGLHRLKACAEAGVEPRYEFLDDDADPVQYVIAKNGLRRQMDDSQRAVVAHGLSQWSTPGRPRRDEENCSKLNSLSQGAAAEALQVSRTLVSYASRVLAEDSPAVPALQQAVREWKVKVSDAARVAKKSPEVQQRALDLLEKEEVRTLTGGARQAEREIAQAEEAEVRESSLALALGDTVTLHTATVAALQTLVAPASVDVIITHPPHTEAFLPTFSDLATFAAHALKPGGTMVVVGSGVLLNQTLHRLEHPELKCVAELDLVFRGKPINSGPPYFMRLHRRPVLVYRKGQSKLESMDDLFEVPPPEALPWGTSEHDTAMAMLVERFVRPGQTVCDPVMMDRAGTALAARKSGCTFIGAERIGSCVDRIRRRLEEAEADSLEQNGTGSEPGEVPTSSDSDQHG